MCGDALDLCRSPGRNPAPRSGERGRCKPPPIFSLARGNPSCFPVSSSPSSVLWSDACSRCALLKPEEGGVAQAAPGPAPKSLGWFSELSFFTIPPSPMVTGWGWAAAVSPQPPASTTGRGGTPALCRGTARDSFSSHGFQGQIFVLVPLRCRDWPSSGREPTPEPWGHPLPRETLLGDGAGVSPWAPGVSEAEGRSSPAWAVTPLLPTALSRHLQADQILKSWGPWRPSRCSCFLSPVASGSGPPSPPSPWLPWLPIAQLSR